jgi:hypothetical protein
LALQKACKMTPCVEVETFVRVGGDFGVFLADLPTEDVAVNIYYADT